MKTFYLLPIFLTPLALLAQGATVVVGDPPPRSNFVFILADDYGIDNVGAYGAAVIENGTPVPMNTPHLDQLAD